MILMHLLNRPECKAITSEEKRGPNWKLAEESEIKVAFFATNANLTAFNKKEKIQFYD